MRPRALIFFAVVIVVAGTVGTYLYTRSRASTPTYRLARVERGSLTTIISATGALNAVIAVQVGSQVSGQIKELHADFNSQVKKGQIISRLAPEIFEAKVNQAEAQLKATRTAVLSQRALGERTLVDMANSRAALAVAKALTAKAEVAVVDAQRDLSRKRVLRKKELIAQADEDSAQTAYDSAMAQLEAAKAQQEAQALAVRAAEAQLRVAEAQLQTALAQVENSEAVLRQAQVDIEHTIIRAPVDGVVVSRNVDVGQTVAASLQAPTIFTIAQDLTQMQVDTSVDEADIGQIRLGQRATFTVNSFPGQTFTGDVIQIRKAPQVLQNVTTYVVVVSTRNPDFKLLPGMTANVRIVADQKVSILKVPNSALRFQPRRVRVEDNPHGVQPGQTRHAKSNASQSPDAIKQRLVRELRLTVEQQRMLDPILQEGRRTLLALQAQELSQEERRDMGQGILSLVQDRLREILTPAQLARYDQLMADQSSAQGSRPGQVWVLEADGKPRPRSLQLGISDGSFTEVVAGDLKEGQEVIVGSVERPAPGPGRSRAR